MAFIPGTPEGERIYGAEEADVILGLAGDDRLHGLDGEDLIFGGAGSDRLFGGFGVDWLFGDGGDDLIRGGRAGDLIYGGGGADLLFGGAGPDTFHFDDLDTGDAFADPRVDRIMDFDADDVIDLLAVDVLRQDLFSRDPSRGAFTVWEDGGSAFLSWNTQGSIHDVEVVGYSAAALLDQIRWYNDDYADDPTTTGEVEVGASTTGDIEVAADADWFRVELVAGETYVADLSGVDGGGGSWPDPFLSLYDANGAWIDANDDDGVGFDARLYFTASASGAHYLAAEDIYEVTGTYTLSVASYEDDFAGDPTTTGEIAVGGSVTGEIAPIFEADWFRAEFVAGESYAISLSGLDGGGGSWADPTFAVYDADGDYITGDDDGGVGFDSQLIFTATETGAHYLAAEDYWGYTGTYTLSVASFEDDFAGDPTTTGEIAVGGSVTGEIAPSDRDWFRAELVAGESYDISLSGLDGGGGSWADPFLVVYDAGGGYITESDDGGVGFDSQLNFTATETGVHYLAAEDIWGFAGTYTLSLQSQDALV